MRPPSGRASSTTLIDPSRLSHAIPIRLQILLLSPGLSMTLYAIHGFFDALLSVAAAVCKDDGPAWFSIHDLHRMRRAPAAAARSRSTTRASSLHSKSDLRGPCENETGSENGRRLASGVRLRVVSVQWMGRRCGGGPEMSIFPNCASYLATFSCS